MRISKTTITNFRGVKSASLVFPDHSILVGDNNVGKTTILEAIDLAMGPDRLNRFPAIDEHDFYRSMYLKPQGEDENQPEIRVEVILTNLSIEHKTRFGDYVEWWDKNTGTLYSEPNPEGVDEASITTCVRIIFIGVYDEDEDDFQAQTYYGRTLEEFVTPKIFGKKDKQLCGFLYLRTLRTGSRAISLERGSLLDIILRLQDTRPQMWENTLSHLANYDVAGDPETGVTNILETLNNAIKKYMPKEWGEQPHLKITNLTREQLRKVVTSFVSTSDGHSAPFYRQGTGTINMLVLALLSQIAAEKQNVIFAMEEPEIAVPPYAQKRIVDELRLLSAQSIFTSHSPYVLEEFEIDETLVLARDNDGNLTQSTVALPKSVKLKRYRQEFRTRFCEGLLARRILVAEGATEASAIPAAARRLAELCPDKYSSIEALGICVIDAGSDSAIAPISNMYKALNKDIYGLCDKQSDEQRKAIESSVIKLYEHNEKGFEMLVLNNTNDKALAAFAGSIEWPQSILDKGADPISDLKNALFLFFKDAKGVGLIADYLASCGEADIPEWIRKTCIDLKELCSTSMRPAPVVEETEVSFL